MAKVSLPGNNFRACLWEEAARGKLNPTTLDTATRAGVTSCLVGAKSKEPDTSESEAALSPSGDALNPSSPHVPSSPVGKYNQSNSGPAVDAQRVGVLPNIDETKFPEL
ncbi:MAG: hypothetical protein FRX49_12752 [Trebouxia sp. A1-2]|nr:MAG: hypothetical protein FRX49_12752 [Trebouxia sp. A1-2]